MTYKHSKANTERYAIKKSSKWKTAGSVLVASLIFGTLSRPKWNKGFSRWDEHWINTLNGFNRWNHCWFNWRKYSDDNTSKTTEQAQNRLQVLQLRLASDTDSSTISTQQVRQRTRLHHPASEWNIWWSKLRSFRSKFFWRLLKAQLVKPQHPEANNEDENTCSNTSSSTTEATASQSKSFGVNQRGASRFSYWNDDSQGLAVLIQMVQQPQSLSKDNCCD